MLITHLLLALRLKKEYSYTIIPPVCLHGMLQRVLFVLSLTVPPALIFKNCFFTIVQVFHVILRLNCTYFLNSIS